MNNNFITKCEEIFEKKCYHIIDQNKKSIYEKSTNFKLSEEMIYIIENYEGVFIKENYGFVSENISTFADENGFESLNYFLGFNDKYNLFSEFDKYKEQLPSGYIPIATLDGGNLICMDHQGYVYIWLHDEQEEKSLFLANRSFEQFIFSIKKESSKNKKINVDNAVFTFAEDFWD